MTTPAEQRDFRISTNMIWHLIKSQAGTIEKALMELVMNSSDAGSSVFKLTIDTEGFVAEDEGIGFRSKEEIESWFEELGFAHTSELHQDESRMSRFGLGRAQCMCFAPTIWQTNEFQMAVDIQAKGLGYELSPNSELTPGCKVSGKWYTPLSFADLKEVLTGFEELVAYADITIEVNGRVINKKHKWDYSTDTVNVKRRETGQLYVYNKGFLVRTYPAHTYGSGIVVSKVPFILNIARNDILTSECDTWKEVRKFLKEDQAVRTSKKTKLSDDERRFLIGQLLSGEISYDANMDAPIIEDVSGRKARFSRLQEGNVTVHTSGNKLLADRIHQSKAAFVISGNMLDYFSVDTAQELIDALNEIICRNRPVHSREYWELKFVPIEELLDGENPDFVQLKDKELTKVETAVVKALRSGLTYFQDAVRFASQDTFDYRKQNKRKLFVGDSQGAAKGWTDGKTYICIDRSLIKQHGRDGMRGFIGMANVIVHELIHEHNTSTGHQHSEEFYEIFHNVLCGQYGTSYGTGLRTALAHYLGTAQKTSLKYTKNEQRDADREVAIEREVLGTNEFVTMIQAEMFAE